MLQKVLIVLFILIGPTIVHAEGPIVNTSKPYTYSELLKDVVALRETFPKSIEVDVIGETTLGREIPAIKVGNGKKHVLFIGSHHGREWLTTSLLMKMIEEYAVAYEKNETVMNLESSILNDISIWFIPMLNPDGVMIQQEGITAFPLAYQQLLLEMNQNDLDFKKWKANGIGIDLNRQYPAGWEKLKKGPTTQSYQFYKGKHPLEAKETKALVDFTYQIDPLISVSYHSSGRVLYWYYKNDLQVVNRDYRIAKRLSKLTGYKLAKPPKKATGGGFTDWFITEFKRPAFTPEISYEVDNTNPPLSVFTEEWDRNKGVGLMIANEAQKIK